MIVIELTENKFGKAMENLKCIKEKMSYIEELFNKHSEGQSARSMRSPRGYSKDYDEYDDEEEELQPRRVVRSSRYM